MGMAVVNEQQASNTRSLPLQPKLRLLLEQAATAAGIDEVFVYSGGQPPYPGRPRIGSTRHDDGWAADLRLIVGGRPLRFSNAAAEQRILAFVEEAAALGANGMGAAVDYMGDREFHVGFGETPADRRRLVWGKDGRSANAPAWLRRAAQAGWARAAGAVNPASAVVSEALRSPGSYTVIAREGLRLRGGPGLDFEKLSTIPVGTTLLVIEFADAAQAWAKVDLHFDGLADGFVYAPFLEATADSPA
jgi:hypothetical protein